MKNRISYWLILGIMVGLFACEPFMEDKPELGAAPTAEQLNFTITGGDNAYNPVFENTSTVSGIVTWDFGNGISNKGNKVSAYYPMPDDYTVTMTVFTKGGSASISKVFTQTETDYSLFTDPFMIALSGGVDNLEGKAWVIDSLEAKHLGVGPPDSYNPDWWAAEPLGKAGHYLYDDEFTFKIIGFEYKIDTKGATHVNGDGNAATDGLAAGHYTGIIWEDSYDKDVSVNDAARGKLSWSVTELEGKKYIQLSSQAGVISYDDGNPRSYEVLAWSNDALHLRTVGGAARYHKLIRKGYARPVIKFEMNVVEAGTPNTYNYSIGDVVIPSGESIEKLIWNFGDGETVETTNYQDVISHTYMRKGNYPVSLVVVSSSNFNASTALVVAQNHPDYKEFLIDGIVMYNDFSEVSMTPMAVENGVINIVDNPLVQYPNKSHKVLYLEKTNQEWANTYMRLPDGYRYDLRMKSVVRLKVYGKAGDIVLLKFENTDRGGNAWQTGSELTYTIQKDNTWEIVEYDFKGVGAGWDWTGDIFTTDIAGDDRFNHEFHNIIRIMINPGVGAGTHSVYIDELAGPHVEGLKSGKVN